MNELEKRAAYHRKRLKGLSPFCSLGESEGHDPVVYNETNDKNFDYSSINLDNSKEGIMELEKFKKGNKETLKEAPDMFGYMTDDELDDADARDRADLEKRLADRRARTIDKRSQWQQYKGAYDDAVDRFKNVAGKVLEQLTHKFESGKLLQWGNYETSNVKIYKQYNSDKVVFKPIGTNKKNWLDTITYSLSTGKVNFTYYKDDIARYLDAYDQLAKLVDSCALIVSDWVNFIEDQNKQSTDKAINRFLGSFVDNPSNIDCAFDCSNPGHYAHGCRYYIFSVDGKVYHYEDYDSGAYTNNHVHQIRCFDRIDIKNYVWDECNPVLDKVDPTRVGLSVKGDPYGSLYLLGGVVRLSALTSGKGTPTDKVVRLGYYTSPDKVRHSVYFYSNERDVTKAQSQLAGLVPNGSVQVGVAGQTSESEAKKKGFTLIESKETPQVLIDEYNCSTPSELNESRKKKKGIHINRNAGNVEYNVAMFNKMNSPIDGPETNPISGPFGGEVSSGASMGESLESKNPEMIELEYEDITVTVYGEQRDADDWDEWEVQTDWSYKVSKNDIEVLIFENYISDEDIPDWDDMSEDDVDKFISEHFTELFEKYEEQIKEYYYDDAVKDAQERYEYEPDYPEYDPYDEQDLWEELHKPIRKNSVLDEGMADDNFDIFLRGV